MISTKDGPLRGAKTSSGCAYEGIPFAAPPTGPLRWKAAAPPKPWTTPRASTPASGCAQTSSPFGAPSADEDCLYLNVWTPDARASMPSDVMVFVHGGAFMWGSGTFGLYDGTKLAGATGNIVVTLNYRLGPFGFLSNAELRAEDPHHSAGNYGMLDQLAALEWIHDNVVAFGGDPARVTIFGESAGGTSMLVDMTSPLFKGLYARVIMESAFAPYLGMASLPESVADGFGATFASAAKCNGPNVLSCLRGKSTSEILDATPETVTGTSPVIWLPVVDGYAIATDPMHAFNSGSFEKVPTLLGNNADEGTLFLYLSPPSNQSSFTALEEAQYPGHGAAIVAQYPATSYSNSYFQAASAALADGETVCPTRRVARAIAGSGTPTYRYDFTHAVSFIAPLGAFHGSELLFVFGNPFPPPFGTSLQRNELPLSHEMMQYWGTMAKTGDPNGKGLFVWPKYDLGTEPEIVLDLTLHTVNELRKPQCDFWDTIESG